MEPIIIRAFLALGRTQSGVKTVGIKINALRASVVEHAVQNNADTSLSGLSAERFEICLCAKKGVDLLIVRRIVAMVGGGLKNGAEIETRDTQSGQVVQVSGDASQRAAKEIPVFDLAIFWLPGGGFVPFLMNPTVPNQALRTGN